MNELRWIEMDSSAVDRAAFDMEAETIYVRFKSGATYRYYQCPQQVWEEFTTPGQSAGQYVNHTLRHKPYEKLDW